MILIQNLSMQSMNHMVEGMEDWFTYWFEWFRTWQAEDVCHKRRIWARWIRVPIHAWSQRFFKIACGKIGVFIKLDHHTANRENLVTARFLISTSYHMDVNCSFKVMIDETFFTIKVMEEYPMVHEWNQDGEAIMAEDELMWSNDGAIQ